MTRAILIQRSASPDHPSWFTLSDNPTDLRGVHGFTLSILHEHAVEQQRALGNSWAVTTKSYWYEVRHADGPMILAYHWHPDSRSPVTFPHLHIGAQSGHVDLTHTHLPTGIIPLADILRYAIVELGVQPLRPDWHAILNP